MSKTLKMSIELWFNTLAEPYRSQALSNLQKYPYSDFFAEVESLHDALRKGFRWQLSKEGEVYWDEISSLVRVTEKYFELDKSFKQSEKFIPTHEELLEWGFEPFKTSTIALSKKHFYDYYQKISPNKFYMQYYPYDNSLMEFGGKTKTFPFTTKQDFMKAVGVSNIEELIANHDKKKLIKKTLQAVCYLSDEVLEMTVNNIINILSRES